MEDWASDSFSEDYEATQSDEGLSEPPLVEPLAFSTSAGETNSASIGSEELDVEMTNWHNSEWFQSRFNDIDAFLGTSLDGLEVQAMNFLLTVWIYDSREGD